MKKKTIAFLMAFALLCNQVAFPVNNVVKPISASAGITDTVPEGYTAIYTIDDLYAVRNNLSGKYILMNDIDLSETAPGGDWDSGNGWKPIGGKGENYFSGVFDGNGYAIKNMHIYGKPDENYIGLFGQCDTKYGYQDGGVIEHLALVDCDIDIESDSLCIGSIAGSVKEISECFATGSFKVTALPSGEIYIGGVCGTNISMRNCFNGCNISVTLEDSLSHCYIGGVVGKSYMNTSGSLGNYYLYNIGSISVTKNENVDSHTYTGNLLGSVYALKSGYYLKSLSDYKAVSSHEDSDYTNVVGLTAGQMKSSAAFTGFDFDTVWTIDPNAEYPYPTLRNVPYVSSGASAPTTEPSQPTTQPQTPSSDTSLKGDINGDGKVDATDASIILIYAAMVGAGYEVSIDDLY